MICILYCTVAVFCFVWLINRFRAKRSNCDGQTDTNLINNLKKSKWSKNKSQVWLSEIIQDFTWKCLVESAVTRRTLPQNHWIRKSSSTQCGPLEENVIYLFWASLRLHLQNHAAKTQGGVMCLNSFHSTVRSWNEFLWRFSVHS